MNDPTLAALFGRLQVSSVPSSSSSTTAQSAPQVPVQIAELSSGSLIQGYVINRDTHNNPILRTDYGDVTVKSDVFLKTGSEVVLRIQSQANQVMARIVSVNGTPIQDVAKQQNLIAQQSNFDVVQQSPISSTSDTIAVQDPLLVNKGQNFLQATLLKPATVVQQPETLAAMLKMPPAVASSFVKGAPLEFKVISSHFTTPENATAPTQLTTNAQKLLSSTTQMLYSAYNKQPGNETAQLNTLTQPSTNTAPATNTQTAPTTVATTTTASTAPNVPTNNGMPAPANASPTAQPTTPAPAGAPPTPPNNSAAQTDIKHVIQNNIHANMQAKGAAPEANNTVSNTNIVNNLAGKPGVISATVIGTEPNGESIVRTPIGTVRLFTVTPPPINSVLQLQLIMPELPTVTDTAMTTSTTSQSAANNVHDLLKGWGTLKELEQMINVSPEIASAMASRVPNTKSKMVNSVLFFLSALKSGDMRSWLGQANMQLLDNKSPGLLRRLTADIGIIRNADTIDQPWQMLPVPVMHDKELDQIHLFIKRDEEENDPEKGTRFVIDIELSQLGKFQIDGFTRYHENGLHFDLVVRTEKELEPKFQNDIKTIFSDAKEQGNFDGGLSFHVAPDAFVEPLEENLRHLAKRDGSIIA